MNDFLRSIPIIEQIAANADVLDIKQAEGTQSLHEYAIGCLSYQPVWVSFLFGLRAMIVPFFGLWQRGIPRRVRKAPSELPMQPGQKYGFFTVEAAEEEHYWIASANDDHLAAHLCIVREPLTEGRNRFYVITVVHYRNWAGPVYFNLIRPFHHVVVGGMTRAGVTHS